MKLKLLFSIYFLCIYYVSSQENNYSEVAYEIKTNTITLKGTLLKTNSHKKVPLVIIIPGSGPTDRDGNNAALKNNSLKFLAEQLAKNNIASYRYDKSVLSFTKEQLAAVDTLTFDSFIYDAKNVIAHFYKSKNYSKIIVAGHSQGSLVGILASNKFVNGLVSLEGAGTSINNVLAAQIEKQAPFLKEETTKILDSLKNGKTVSNINPMLNGIFNKSVQPFLISWIRFNPEIEINKLTIPVLIIGGTKDIQVSIEEAKVLHKAAQKSQLAIIENMNHILKEIKGDVNENMSSYTNPELPIMEELTKVITTFINDLK